MARNSSPVLRLATVLAILASIVMGVLTLGVATGRWQAAPVLTGSMHPAIEAGAVLLAEHRPTADLRVGDVIVFHAPTPARPVMVHRIVDIADHDGRVSVTTKGDANEEPDPWGALAITAPRTWTVTGSLAGVGRLVVAARSPIAQLVALVLLAVASAFMIDRSRTRRRRGPGGERPIGHPRERADVSGDRAPKPPSASLDRPTRGPGNIVVVAVATAVAVAAMLPAARAALADVETDDVSISTGVLASPSDLVATPGFVVGACQVELAWTLSPSLSATGYEILRQPLGSDLLGGDGMPTGDYEVVLVVEGRETAAATDTLPPELVQLDSTFRYVARSTRDGWHSPYSNSADVDVMGVCT